jgi:hypothetical protein
MACVYVGTLVSYYWVTPVLRNLNCSSSWKKWHLLLYIHLEKVVVLLV